MRIGLTGSIAAGKSTVSERLRQLGAHVIDADAVAREVVEPGTPGLLAVVAAFGAEVLTDVGALDRKKLAERVFPDETARLTLNAIVHPLVIEKMQQLTALWEAEHPKGVIVWDVPLLIECGAWKKMDAVWLVVAQDDTRLARILARDGGSKEQALARMAAQMPQEEKALYATTILENDGDVDALLRQVDRCFYKAQGVNP